MSLIVLMVVLAALEQNATPQQPKPELPTIDLTVEVLGSTVGDFTTKMDAYAQLRQALQKGLPELTVIDNPTEIRRVERLLAERIRRARAGASRGDIFTEDIRHAFRQLLRPVTNPGTCAAVRDDNPGEFAYAINGEYPKNKPVSTVPPSMLAVLPRLPDDVTYRFLDRNLILHDLRANIILDRVDNAIRCDR